MGFLYPIHQYDQQQAQNQGMLKLSPFFKGQESLVTKDWLESNAQVTIRNYTIIQPIFFNNARVSKINQIREFPFQFSLLEHT